MSPLPPSSIQRVTSSLASSSRPPLLAGALLHKDHRGNVLGRKKIYASREIVIGRDKSRCQYVLDDPYVSKRHLRIYTIVYENDDPSEVDTLVYAEDLSQNGTYWNGALIGKGNGGFLLSDKDILRLSRQSFLIFVGTRNCETRDAFDLTQETEMANFRKEYVLTDRLLGAGTFGKVFMAVEQSAHAQVACKVVDLRQLMPKSKNYFGRLEQPAAAEDVDSRVQMRKIKAWVDEQKKDGGLEKKLRQYFREVEVLSTISHPNIIGIEKVYVTDNTIYIMQDLVTAGDLFSYIESKNGRLLEAEAAVIIRQIVVALRFLHERNIVHRDIKPDNILMASLSAGCRVVLTDFGAARRIENRQQRMSSVIGTIQYAAPEILNHFRKGEKEDLPGYTRSVDMWALGCVAVVLLTGEFAFCDPATKTYSEKLARNCNMDSLRQSNKEWQTLRERPKDFVERLLVHDDEARMTAEDALEHPWFSNEIHKKDFEDLYLRTVKDWHPRIPKAQAHSVEFQDSGTIRNLSCSRTFRARAFRGSNKSPHSQSREQPPAEPPYKPFPRNMHLPLWPKRDPAMRLSHEVLSAIEKSSPASARALALRAKNMSSPSSALGGAGPGNTRGVRAALEPPPTRSFAHPKRTDIAIDGRVLAGREGRQQDRMKDRDAQDQAVPARPPTPRPAKVTMFPQSRSFSRTGSSSSRGSVTGVLADAEEPREASFGYPTDTGMALRDYIVSRTQSPATGDEKGDSSLISGGETPERERKLKRRISTPTLTSERGHKRRGSIFDLAEDSDSDGDSDGSRVQKNPLTHRPRFAPVEKPRLQPLYLPR